MHASRMMPSLMATKPTCRGAPRQQARRRRVSSGGGSWGKRSQTHSRCTGVHQRAPPQCIRPAHALTCGWRYQQGWPRRVMLLSIMSSATRK